MWGGGGGAGDVLKQSHNTANTTTFQIHEKEAQTIRTENHCSQSALRRVNGWLHADCTLTAS